MDLRCQYASTHCPNMRSLKISGDLHRFCLFHRRSANAAQRRWKQKKLAEAAASSEDDTKQTPHGKTAGTRRRLTPKTEMIVKQEPIAKRPRRSREIAAPRALLAIQQATQALPVFQPTPPGEFAVDGPSSLFSTDDVSLLSKLILDVEDPVHESAFPVAPSDCWWGADASFQQDAGVIV